MTERKSYDEIIEAHPEFKGVIHENSWNFIGFSDEGTLEYLKGLWIKNIRKNAKKGLWKKHKGIYNSCSGLGMNKAVIMVGAGQSFNKNKHVLKQIHDYDAIKDWENRDFIIVASNHQFKPLLKMGIIPDFVAIADASDVIMDQLCKDIPKEGQHCTLLAGMHCDPSVLSRWHAQGREIKFYMAATKGLDKVFKECTGEDAGSHTVLQGGCVSNTVWSIGLKHFKSSVYIALGNDLSFPLKDTITEQRASYYADGDYSSNAVGTGTGRDEAQSEKQWMGFSFEDGMLYTASSGLKKSSNINIAPVGTNYTLWVYKTWLEGNVLGTAKTGGYHYYNCSEGGIAGVMCRDEKAEDMSSPDNWFLMDEVCKPWHTKKLEDAVEQFRTGKDMYTKWKKRGVIKIPARSAAAF